MRKAIEAFLVELRNQEHFCFADEEWQFLMVGPVLFVRIQREVSHTIFEEWCWAIAVR